MVLSLERMARRRSLNGFSNVSTEWCTVVLAAWGILYSISKAWDGKSIWKKKKRKKDDASPLIGKAHPFTNLRCLGIWILWSDKSNSPQILFAEYFFPPQFFYMINVPKCTVVLLHNAVAAVLLRREVRMLRAQNHRTVQTHTSGFHPTTDSGHVLGLLSHA